MIEMIHEQGNKPWDVIVIGGGATGLGCAVDAVTRGYKTLLIERADFAKSTSGKSTKLVHGGVRYLAQGDMKLVKEALTERGLLEKNARHLVKNIEFIIPVYSTFDKLFYAAGLKLYDFLSGSLSFGNSTLLSPEQTLLKLPGIKQNGLKGGIKYHDGQFDDARLAVNLMQTIGDNQGIAINYMEVTGLLKSNSGIVQGVIVKDRLEGTTYELLAKVVINATGVFADTIQQMDDPDKKPSIRSSRGVHIVLPNRFLPSSNALMIPKTSDGRVLFAVPWYNKLVVGTTDTPDEIITDEPVALVDEIDFILENAASYLAEKPTYQDILSVFAGLRPLAASTGTGKKTKEISRGHQVVYSTSGLITVLGGKWTTYRKMAEDAINLAKRLGNLPDKPCQTRNLSIHGNVFHFNSEDPLHIYGSDADEIRSLMALEPSWKVPIHPSFTYTIAELVWSIRHEMPQTLEDLLSRRTRCLLLDAKAALEIAPQAAQIMAQELNKDDAWIKLQLQHFSEIASGYLISELSK
ncbi:MAG: glycerol-3-phosphate dehydrogenase/oxidase [Flavobacteriales bacterium]|nr:glycerol-3-phosphate dehydrogenase/oxidase [Flavobacteriales bacterium]